MIFIVLINPSLFGQTIEIGEDANQVKAMIEWSTRDKTGYDNYGNSRGNNVAWDVKYNDGQITDVIQCYTHQYLIEFRMFSSFCKHYIMKNGKLAYVLTQYEDISTKYLKDLLDKSYSDYKYGEYYFSKDYKHNSRVYLASNNNSTVEWRQTELNKLPKEIQNKISNILKRQQQAKEINKLQEEQGQGESLKDINQRIRKEQEQDSIMKVMEKEIESAPLTVIENLPFKMDEDFYINLLNNKSAFLQLKDTTAINNLLTESLKNKILALNRSTKLEEDYTFFYIGKYAFKDYKLEIFLYQYHGIGDQLKAQLNIRDKSGNILDTKEIGKYVDSELASFLTTCSIDNKGIISMKISKEKSSRNEKYQINTLGKIIKMQSINYGK